MRFLKLDCKTEHLVNNEKLKDGASAMHLALPCNKAARAQFFQISSDPIASMYWLRLMGSNANHSPFATLPLLD